VSRLGGTSRRKFARQVIQLNCCANARCHRLIMTGGIISALLHLMVSASVESQSGTQVIRKASATHRADTSPVKTTVRALDATHPHVVPGDGGGGSNLSPTTATQKYVTNPRHLSKALRHLWPQNLNGWVKVDLSSNIGTRLK
jgi:hypothetical protein